MIIITFMLFPSPYGESFSKLLPYSVPIAQGNEQFPSPYGESFSKS